VTLPAIAAGDATAAAGPSPVVARSACGRSWRLKPADPVLGLAISQRHGLPELIGRILAGRGVLPDEVADHIDPKLRTLLPDPSHLLDLDRAVARLADAVSAGETIGLLGDYDVDGATSTALLARYLRAVGATTVIDVPDRLAEGYGPNPAAIDRLIAQGARLAVTLDCGTTAFAPLDHAASRGLDVVVVDHHVAEARLPAAVAVVNPNRRDQESRIGDLAAVGVTFVLVVGLNRTLRERGLFGGRPEPDLRQWLDLVALGTICDVVPLGGLNRALVRAGLKVMSKGANPGLVALAGAAGARGPFAADQLGFVLGPRINAGGRVGASHLGALLLSEDDPAIVGRTALELHQLNETRRARQKTVVDAALRAVEEQVARDEPLLAAAGEGWSAGVVGLAAARLAERFLRPAIVAGIEAGAGGSVAKGSGRSIDGFDLGGAVIAARGAGLLDQGGGHPMAAGFTLPADRFETFRLFLTDRVRSELGDRPPPVPPLDLDGSLRVRAVSFDLARTLSALAPYGRDNPEPSFMLPDVRIASARRMGDSHVDCSLTDAGGGRLRGLAFRAAASPLGDLLLNATGATLHLAGRVRLDRWQDRQQVTLEIADAARP
jgi:single-stranded-DNA-specific exonuclease